MHFPLSFIIAALPFITVSSAQSVSDSQSVTSQSQSQSQSQSASSSSPSSSGTPAGGGGGSSGSFDFQEYLAFLNQSGYTSLSSALQQASQNDQGRQWIDQLSQNRWTVFAPTNDAFSSVPQNVSSDPATLSDYLAYHYVYGDLHNATSGAVGGGAGNGGQPSTAMSTGSHTGSSTGTGAGAGGSASQTGTGGGAGGSPSPTGTGAGGGGSPSASGFALHHLFSRQNGGDTTHPDLYSGIYPNDTIGRTALQYRQGGHVRLEGNKDQVLAWTRFSPNNNVTILNQRTSSNQNVTVGNSTRWRNLDIYQINDVLIPPGNVSQAVQAVGDYPLLTFGNQVQVPGPSGSNITIVQALENTHGLTLFAPVSSAFTSQANQTLQSLQQNSPQQFLNGVHNHYINGSTVYAPTLREVAANGNGGAPYTSAGGQYFSFTTNNTGLYVSVGNDTNARVVIPDVLVENGVIHFIDTVLFQTNGNDEVASSAFASASAAATESSTDTQAIIFPEPTGSMPGGQSSGTTTTSQSSSTPSSFRVRRGIAVL